ncbi:MAG TPA: spore coat protein [Firmicutes bacterium]|nr:spore coat protein [Bacillota bacterium]
MHINLTAKERRLLEEQKNHEEICVQKYNDYANLASDQQLKAIFKNNAQTEQEHLNTIDQLLNGQLPPVNQQGQNNTAQLSQPQQSNNFRMQNNFATNQSIDRNLCSDMLMTEKYVSGAYDTAIFEFRDPQIRQTLNHIQKEEQQHGEAILNYMVNTGMYNPQ